MDVKGFFLTIDKTAFFSHNVEWAEPVLKSLSTICGYPAKTETISQEIEAFSKHCEREPKMQTSTTSIGDSLLPT
jgi:hypothetical protein